MYDDTLAGIPFCPLPPLHPDLAARRAAFTHLQDLLDGPILVADDTTISAVKELIPEMKFISLSELNRTSIIDEQFTTSVFPQAVPNPDDIACLMLTSGSTGNSKAVALSHSNILSSVRGKIKHHGTNSFSRFFNWIALHHVACFTEIHFHALEADARYDWSSRLAQRSDIRSYSQFHVSSMAIIQRPINLLEWCSKLTITYTFSPNFLIAQLCRDVSAAPSSLRATNLSSLRVFISGGEAVPVRTAVDFADLLERCGAPRDALRAGFGMTETGVSLSVLLLIPECEPYRSIYRPVASTIGALFSTTLSFTILNIYPSGPVAMGRSFVLSTSKPVEFVLLAK